MNATPNLRLKLAAAACCVALAGCAAAPTKGWKVEGVYRLDGTGASAADGYLALGRQYEGEARHLLALDAYRKAASLAPGNADVMNALGLALARQSQHGAAIVAFRHAVMLDPTRPALLNNLGYALLLDVQTEEAKRVLQQALLQDPSHSLAQMNLARLRPLDSVVQPSGPVPTADALDMGVNALQSVGPLALSETSTVAEDTSPAMQLRIRPDVEAFSLTSADAVGTRAAGMEARLEGLAQADPSFPLSSAAAAPPEGPPAYGATRIEISNGNGVRGMGARIGRSLRSRQLAYAVRLTNMRRYDLDATVVEYRPGFAKEAQIIANSLGAVALVHPSQADLRRSDIRVLLGHDLETAVTSVACRRDAPRLQVATGPHSSCSA